MRFLHLSDLHLGKRVCEFSMLDDQRYILEQVLSLLDARPVDGVLLAGDLYDKPVPPAEAVRLLDWFLTQLAARGLPVFAISGNHDSADRVAFGSALLETSRVYVSPVFSGAPVPIPLTDEEVDKLGVHVREVSLDYAVGHNVQIMNGPLEGFIGIVEGIDTDAKKVNVKVSMFGRETPAELDFTQVKPL